MRLEPNRNRARTTDSEILMSRINGDKARFNRQRKQKIARRKRNHARLKELFASKAAPAPAKPTPVQS